MTGMKIFQFISYRTTSLPFRTCVSADAIVKAFEKAASEKRTAFIPYVTAGFPTKDDTVPMMLAMEKGGAGIDREMPTRTMRSLSNAQEIILFHMSCLDVIELGVPFSDPQADGPTIQAVLLHSRSPPHVL
jgi:tryptophan synthase